MTSNINHTPLRTWTSIEQYWRSGNIYGFTTPNYPKLEAQIHYNDGWREYIRPVAGIDFNPETERLGELYHDLVNDVVTNQIDVIPIEEIQQMVLSQAESLREEKLQYTIKQQIEEQFQAITDDTEALENQEAFPLWTSFEDGHTFPIGFKVQHLEDLEMKLYKVLQSHAKQDNWFPANVPALFVKILPEGAPLVWEAGIFVTVGEEYLYTPNGNTYIVVQSHTTQIGWEPPNVPSLWQLKVV